MEELIELVEEPYKIRWKRTLLIRYLRSCYADRFDVSYSIWGRCSPREPGSCALKGCAKEFLRHLDVTKARCLTFTEYTTAPEKSNVTDMNVLRDLHYTRTALFTFARAMQAEHAQQARGSIATMTLSGRLAYNHVHIVCLRNAADEPFEYVAAVMPLAPGEEQRVTLAHFTDMDDALASALKPKQTSKKKAPPPPPRTKADQHWSVGNPEVWQPNLAMCFLCGKSGSIMMRDGPAGPASLCNVCGLKLAKEYPHTAANYEDLVPPPSPTSATPSKLSPPTFSPDQELDSEFSYLDPLFAGSQDLYQPAAAPPTDFFPIDL